MQRRFALTSVQVVAGIVCLLLPTLAKIADAQSLASTVPAHFTPIYAIQGSALRSPLEGQRIDTVGLITGVIHDGFYLQDVPGDGDPLTSDAVFVYTRVRPKFTSGQCVVVFGGHVEEFYAKTELVRPELVESSDLCGAQPVMPVPMPTPRFRQEPAHILEALEGMLVEAEVSGFVQGPAKHYANGEQEIALVAEWAPRYVAGQRIFQHDSDYIPALFYLSNLLLGDDLPAANWGDFISAPMAEDGRPLLRAVLDYNFGKYQLLPVPGQTIVHIQNKQVEDTVERASAEDFTVCTYNVYGLGRGSAQYPNQDDYSLHLQRHARVVAEKLQACTIVGLQETGTPADAENLAELLASQFGVPYIAIALPGPASADPDFPLTNSLLVLEDRVQVLDVQIRQACTTSDFDVAEMPGDCPSGQFALFNRPPLIVDLAVQGNWATPYVLRLINNHWKSKAGDERVNAPRRLRQATHVASLAQELLDVDPTANIVVLGDLNDFVHSVPIDSLRNGTQPSLVQLYDFVPELDRYTYIFNGASQVLDYLLVTPAMVDDLAAMSPLHINADFADLKAPNRDMAFATSDHDPVQMRIRPDGAASLGGKLHFPGIGVRLVRSGTVLAETVTDALGEFRFWDLKPGDITVEFSAPQFVAIPETELSILLPAGYSTISNVSVRHQTPFLAATMAAITPGLASALVKSAEDGHTEP